MLAHYTENPMPDKRNEDPKRNKRRPSKGDELLLRLLGRRAPTLPCVQEPEPTSELAADGDFHAKGRRPRESDD